MKKLGMFMLVVVSFAVSIFVLFSGGMDAAAEGMVVTLFSIPFAMGLVIISFLAIPKQSEFERYRKGLESIFFVLILVLTIIHSGLVFYLMDSGFPIMMLVPLGVGLVLIATANTLPRFQLETPPASSEYTQSTHNVWNKGLRPFSRPLIIGGLAMLLCTFLPQHLILIGFLTVLACTLLTAVYFAIRTS
ncbi:hypothetical protein B4U37_03630 [Sutcliffiella horikoshii]|uniref:SdpI family protein n=1 Tax=Sutcliffiella horikoshii TaxID=79883 RepID=A0ABM6KFP2_9BACI|nr:hypothetical protein [Sutcliffiella horikoshii]ART75188.1 hypothetical protein B4U37_03630 [Sutcliffiella horikoshii]